MRPAQGHTAYKDEPDPQPVATTTRHPILSRHCADSQMAPRLQIFLLWGQSTWSSAFLSNPQPGPGAPAHASPRSGSLGAQRTQVTQAAPSAGSSYGLLTFPLPPSYPCPSMTPKTRVEAGGLINGAEEPGRRSTSRASSGLGLRCGVTGSLFWGLEGIWRPKYLSFLQRGQAPASSALPERRVPTL